MLSSCLSRRVPLKSLFLSHNNRLNFILLEQLPSSNFDLCYVFLHGTILGFLENLLNFCFLKKSFFIRAFITT